MATRATRIALPLLALLSACATGPKEPTALTPEAKAYVKNLGLAGVEMKAAESFSGQQVVEILGQITNKGDRHLKTVEVMCVFYDPTGQVVARERVAIVREKTGGLKPGDTKPFRLPFDTLPASWNQAAPGLVIAAIVFG
ncbi:MAG: FxLYD domain-containing protein [Acidobacteria bacterium]|nr:FxLYD domain-containing protein [Acidobacteriota bacterium]